MVKWDDADSPRRAESSPRSRDRGCDLAGGTRVAKRPHWHSVANQSGFPPARRLRGCRLAARGRPRRQPRPLPRAGPHPRRAGGCADRGMDPRSSGKAGGASQLRPNRPPKPGAQDKAGKRNDFSGARSRTEAVASLHLDILRRDPHHLPVVRASRLTCIITRSLGVRRRRAGHPNWANARRPRPRKTNLENPTISVFPVCRRPRRRTPGAAPQIGRLNPIGITAAASITSRLSFNRRPPALHTAAILGDRPAR
jgi:hypothetical protein